MRHIIQFLSLTALSLALLSSSAYAQINDSGAERLKTVMTKLLDQQIAAQSVAGTTLSTDGDITVTQAASYYTVRLPEFSTTDANGNRADIGSIAINAVPSEKEGQWKMSIAWPSPITHVGADGQPTLKISLGEQRMSGVFDESIETFVLLDSAYQNVKIDHIENDTFITIPKLDIKYNLSEKQPNIFSGPVSLSAQKISVTNKKDGQELLSLNRATADVNVLEYNAADQKAAKDQIMELSQRVQESDGKDIDTDDQMAVLDMITKNFEALGNGFTSQYRLSGLKINMPENIGTDKPQSVGFGDLVFGLDMTGFKENAVSLSLRLGYKNLNLTVPNQDMDDLTPKNFALNIGLNDIPFQEIVNLGRNSLETSAQGEGAANLARMQAILALPQLLTASNTNLTLNELSFASALAQGKASGKLTANANAKAGAVGFINGQIVGLDDLLKSADAATQKAKETGNDTVFASLYPILVLLSGAAEDGVSDNGQAASNYKITLDDQGQVFINSISLHAAKGGAQ